MQERKMYINGAFTDAISGARLTTLNPSTGEPFGTAPAADAADADRAVQAAAAAFPAWSALPQAERNKYLLRIAERIRAHAEEMAEIEGLEHGTPYKDAYGVCMGAAAKFEWSAAAAFRLTGDQIPVPNPDTLTYVKREPVGVVGFIIPWNLPTIMTAVKLAPALAVGNTCVLKPPSINSQIGLKFAEVIAEAELPPGVVNVITGYGGVVGSALAAHPAVDMIGFTGSSETGKTILSLAAPTVKKCVMELGGNNPVLIFPDADIDAAIKILAWRQFNNSGQHCSGPGRYYVHESVYDAFRDSFVGYARSLKIGDPSKDKAVDMGPLVSAEHRDRVMGYIQSAVSEGAEIACGGKTIEPGFFIEPTVLTGCTHTMKAAREEIFGPVAVLIKYTDSDDLISLANDSAYGLCAHVWTRDIPKGMKLIDKLHVGAVFINCQMLTDEQPWGTSIRESGIGKEGGIYGMEEFTDKKLVCVNYA
ncbi:MAG: aldehyde dehydrogenase family protein [Oscillospiraceae bacterium]|jgi:acyl-CoA reductase-like NAD-dependent aldehyde dehydrogenase|nr:aldehyde dehydrogenase family protein [Oscillospiraceae bacterium]